MPRSSFSQNPVPRPPSAGASLEVAEGQECTRAHAPCPGRARGHVGGEGLPSSLWRSTMCFDNCHHSCSFRHNTRPLPDKGAP